MPMEGAMASARASGAQRTGDLASVTRYPPYPAYRNTDVEWLNDVPAHWRVERLKYVATLNDETLSESTDPNFTMEYVDIGSVDPIEGIIGSETLSFEGAPSRARRIVRHGDVIVSTVRTYLKAISAIDRPPVNMIVSTGLAVVRPRTIHSKLPPTSYVLHTSLSVSSPILLVLVILPSMSRNSDVFPSFCQV